MNLFTWGRKWGIHPEAIIELSIAFGEGYVEPESTGNRPESVVQNAVRREMARKGGAFWRNNSGGAYDRNGNFVRYGLCNDSESLNKKYKSADLVGLRPVRVTNAHVGLVIGQFTCRECKPEGWVYGATSREKAQKRWMQLVASLGGDVGFANKEGTL